MVSGSLSASSCFASRLRQLDRHADGEQRRRHHEDDEQHEHDVDDRRHVDLAHRRPARRRRRPPLLAACLDRSAHGSAPHIDLARQDGRELVGEAFQPRCPGVPASLIEFIVENDRGDGGEQAERGGEQRLGDAGRDHREVGVLADGDGLEARHDAPHRAEQSDERRRRADRRQER